MVIPVHDINPLRRTPWVTYGLIAANVVVLLLTPGTLPGTASSAAVACRQQAFDDRYGAIPHELITGRPLRLVPTGREVATAQGPACVIARPAYPKSPPLSVLTAMFVHAGWLHLLGNMLFLLIFGNNVEDRFRKIPYLIFYLAAGYVAAYGFAAVNSGLGPATGRGVRRDRRRARGVHRALPPGTGLEPGPVPVLHPAAHPGLARARALVRAAVGVRDRPRQPGRRWPTLRTCSASCSACWSACWCARPARAAAAAAAGPVAVM